VSRAHGDPLDAAVELLERSLGYTRVVLADVRPDHLRAPSPCAGWTLERLLAHMEDALDAFTEAATGHVEVVAPAPTSSRLDALREKACALLGAWSRATTPAVTVGDADLEAPLLVATAALEITVHGWDVGQATRTGAPIPRDLARGLLPVAQQVIHPADRGCRFADPLAVSGSAPHDVLLLAYLGRSVRRDLTGPPSITSAEPHPRPDVAS
jgi:uncharacterized protein (TIGR03086 family)